LEAGLKAYADHARKHDQQLKASAVVEPRSARERTIAAEVARTAEKCHKPRPLDGKQGADLQRLLGILQIFPRFDLRCIVS